MNRRPSHRGRARTGALALLLIAAAPGTVSGQTCSRTIMANVVAFDQAIFYNRLGAHDPAGMMFALKHDVDPISGTSLGPGNAKLRDGKRPRPLVLRANEGDCLKITFTNLLAYHPKSNQPGTRDASIHVMGMQLVNGIQDDGSFVGQNASSLVAPGGTATYTLYAEKEGTYLLYSTAQTTGGDGDGGTISKGLFGAVNVQPRGAEWYRSQLTAEEMKLATAKDANGNPLRTPAGHPVINYEAVYPAGHPRATVPILRILHSSGNTAHSDLTAIITGPNKGNFPAGTYPNVVVNRDRHRPFREVTVIFHDEPGLVQAFNNIFDDPRFEHTLHSGRDAFAINYGTGGIGAEVLGNRFGVGPMGECTECKYEEFFLSSWAVGDPAMLVDVPADFDGNGDGQPDAGPKATKALFPEDPSNVYHSYMGDHLKIRNLHAGPKEHHIFHLHAHQWLHTPNSDNSTYLDSQAIGPGGGFTYEITYDGGGNRNKTPGDAIFHCHFYPHFAQGMWALWRVHDVFETGTVLGSDGRPAAGARALPDGEIKTGTPIPAVVPLPGYALAPMPTQTHPGFPFYIPGVAGHRPPKPPLDTRFDGGLPRHVVRGGTASFPKLNTLDFHKKDKTLVVDSLPEAGTALEKAAMSFHAKRTHATYTVDPVTLAVGSGAFITNGRPGVAGAPFADPCVSDQGAAIGNPRTYKGASFQLDAKINKAGWHFPQHRMFGLWDDVNSFISGQRAPEPMFIRANTNDCITYHLVNLIPHEYQLDDFQVRTPTDVIGQHIHLVKFDVTASDGAANGFNYEDGSLSPGEVRGRVHAIRAQNQCQASDSRNGSFACPVAKAHPFFGAGPHNEWVGAQETIQRWYVDDVLNAQGKDRTLRTVFTHDHFGPSTHQQAGLYAGLVTEPQGSTWRDPETGATFGGRHDGGPTSWRADIITANPDSSYREFNVQVADFTLAYTAEANLAVKTFTDPITGHTTPGIADPANAINPPGRFEVGLPFLLRPPVAGTCPNGTAPPCPELVSADDPGTMTVNYRNEPIALRVRDPATNTQAAGAPGDLSFAFQTRTDRADARFNVQPGFYPALTGGLNAGDPFTPQMRAFEGDRVQIRVLVGAHEEGHNFSVHGVQWPFEPADANSGHRNSQMMGISEHYEFVVPPLPKNYVHAQADFLYRAGSSSDDLWNGLWGIMRVSQRGDAGILHLPNNVGGNFQIRNAANFRASAPVCPKSAPLRTFDVFAIPSVEALPGGSLIYNSRPGAAGVGPLQDPNAFLFVRTADLDSTHTIKPGVPIEPLVLRANAGDCIRMVLRVRLHGWAAQKEDDPDGFNTLPMIVDKFNFNQVLPSTFAGLHPQLLAYDVTTSDGAAVGINPASIRTRYNSMESYWYAGQLTLQGDSLVATPVEFGAINLSSSDPIKHASKGLFGALIIEPKGATWTTDANTRASATVRDAAGNVLFREHVLMFQDDVNMRYGNKTAIRNLGDTDDSEDSGQKAFNYRTEPLWFRMGYAPETPLEQTRDFNFSRVLSNGQVGGDPQTPVFTSEVGVPTRFRVLQAGGHSRNHVFQLHGHVWQELPYVNGSKALGNNPLSEWKGSQDGHGPTNHLDILVQRPGGRFGITGDYLFRDQTSHLFDGGFWGIFRVLPSGALTGL